jgi:tetratricopeptide (TPR) repeat protein
MGWLRFFSGRSAQDIEKTGDDFFRRESFGDAKMEYEKALERHRKKPAEDAAFEARLTGKLAAAREALASTHIKTASELFTADCREAAEELLHVASALTDDAALKTEIGSLLRKIAEAPAAGLRERDALPRYDGPQEASADAPDTDEYFGVLLDALPPEEKRSYRRYGAAFKKGFVALNLGDFETASEYLSIAFEEHLPEKTYIPLELATAYLNTGEFDQAAALLESFLSDHPTSERGYPLLLETLWEQRNFDRALERLDTCPEPLAGTMGIALLKGETLHRAGKYSAAENFFRECIARFGREEPLLRGLAGTLEAIGQTKAAHGMYAELMNGCRGCGRRPDMALRQRFADTGIQTGNLSMPVLEIYLGLAQEDPANRTSYYEKVSAIYAALGNEKEALRFRGFSQK